MANTDPIVFRQKEIAGINSYYKMGYFGKGNVMQMESAGSDHGLGVSEDIDDIAPSPGYQVYRVGSYIISDGTTVKVATCSYGGVTYEIEDFIKQYDIKFLTKSVGGPQHDAAKEAYYQRLIDLYNVVLVAPAGNEGVNGVTTAFPVNVAIQVGAISITDSGAIQRDWYSGVDHVGDVDFVYFTGDQEGTSLATPRIVGVLRLLYDRFGNKTQDEFYEMFKSLSVDMELPGLDAPTGWGYPVLHEDDYMRIGKLAYQTKTEGELMIKEFIEKIGPMAREDMNQSGILASLTIAQACLESNYGKSGLTKRAGNLFGMKGSYNGQFVTAATKEFIDGQWLTVQAKFRAYPSWQESVSDHSALFNRLSRYSNLVGCTDYKLACTYVYKDGYATDPDYTQKLINLIETYNLTQFDTEVEDLTREETEKLIKDILLGTGTEPSAWAKEFWDKAKADGITDGTNPKGYITREQVATMIERAMK